ncbi:MAG: deoxyribodipyrimidine photolyase [Gammaproteobacteria bacterium]|nr:MAG: deoxyribodipyrimidine photolyase [Gammaproteobacteria bacterium]
MTPAGGIHDERLRLLNRRGVRENGQYVLYWMQQSQRAHGNHALEMAILEANRLGRPLLVAFGLMTDCPEASARHYAFMLEGLAEVQQSLQERGIAFVMRAGSPDEVAIELAREAAVVVCDRGYLRQQRRWRRHLARAATCRVIEVEGDVVVPLAVASNKAEYAARTIRPKIERQIDNFLVHPEEQQLGIDSRALDVRGDLDPADPEALLASLELDRSVMPVTNWRGGLSEARRRLAVFVDERLADYDEGRSEPAAMTVSMLSPYLHFGQISPIEVALAVRREKAVGERHRKTFVEELVVRRELSCNFVYHHPHYDSYRGLPQWARATLDRHRGDAREHRYTRRELEAAATHDRYWNAAMRDMKATGYLHNTLRMYWGKQIIKWCNTPEYAWQTAIHLNNRYFLDGRDPNSWTGISWLFGLHDRPWQEREVLGTVRTMTSGGLDRKYDMQAYLDYVDGLDQ